jgi:hypothetical protein
MGRHLLTWLGLLLFVTGTSIWLFPYIPSVPRWNVFQPHLVIPFAFSGTLIVGGIVLMLLNRNADDQVRR